MSENESSVMGWMIGLVCLVVGLGGGVGLSMMTSSTAGEIKAQATIEEQATDLAEAETELTETKASLKESQALAKENHQSIMELLNDRLNLTEAAKKQQKKLDIMKVGNSELRDRIAELPGSTRKAPKPNGQEPRLSELLENNRAANGPETPSKEWSDVEACMLGIRTSRGMVRFRYISGQRNLGLSRKYLLENLRKRWPRLTVSDESNGAIGEMHVAKLSPVLSVTMYGAWHNLHTVLVLSSMETESSSEAALEDWAACTESCCESAGRQAYGERRISIRQITAAAAASIKGDAKGAVLKTGQTELEISIMKVDGYIASASIHGPRRPLHEE